MKAWRALAVGVVVAVGACSERSAEPPASTTPYTGPAVELAPSQVSMLTVPEPTVPGRCAQGAIAIEARAGAAPDPDIVVTFHNTGDEQCEVDVDLAWARAHEIEPSVRLAAGARAELWGVAERDCDESERTTVWQLTVNGVGQAVAVPEPTCALAPVAFFPV